MARKANGGNAFERIARFLIVGVIIFLLLGDLILPMEGLEAIQALLPEWLRTEIKAAGTTDSGAKAAVAAAADAIAAKQQGQAKPAAPKQQPAAPSPKPAPARPSAPTVAPEKVDPSFWSVPRQVCGKCCHDGYNRVPCFDVEECARKAPLIANGKYALVVSQMGVPKWPWLTNLDAMQYRAEQMAARLQGSVEIVVLIRPSDVKQLGCRHRKMIRTYKLRLIEVPWLLPPGMLYTPKGWTMQKFVGWCGPIDLVRIHVLGLEEYTAVAYYDQDVELQGDISPMMRCASSGVLLTTNGGVGDALNIGFFAAKPDKRLVTASIYFAGNNTFTRETGWAGAGYAPESGHYVGAECGQGFFHTLFYKKDHLAVMRALEAAGFPKREPRAQQIDRCIWNYQTGVDCPANFNCSLVRGHHKPSGEAHPADCAKFQFRPGSPSPPRPFLPPLKGPSGKCEVQCVEVGKSCDCAAKTHAKAVPVQGRIETCQSSTSNPSGDTFNVAYNETALTVQRADVDACWCDPSVDVECCIDPHPPPPPVKAAPPPCDGCCNDGKNTVPCLDVEACAKRGPTSGKYALVYAHVGRPGAKWLPFAANVRAQADILAQRLGGTVDMIMIMTTGDSKYLGCQQRQILQRHGIKLVLVPWTTPPSMRWYPEGWDPKKVIGWCGPIDLVRLHVLGLEDYTAVAFYDQDIELHGDISQLLRCAATGRFLSTQGGLGPPLNVGFFATKPDKKWLSAAESFASDVTFSRDTGWGEAGFEPAPGYFIGAECGQGFFHTLLYKRDNPAVKRAMKAAGLLGIELAAAQVDGCLYNYQPGFRCSKEWSCEHVRAHHKPGGKPEGADCPKLEFRPGGTPPPPPAVDEGGQDRERGCQWQCVHIGANCQCTGAVAHKSVEVKGKVMECEKQAFNAAGDSFDIFVEGSKVTAERGDNNNCWCDNSLHVSCCVSEL